MIDITHKNKTLRAAIAEATLKVSSQETIDAIQNKTVPKGDVLEMAKTAGLFGVKRTADMIPDCHPIPVESTQVRYAVEGLTVRIEMEVKTIYRTGVEVEAMHGVSVVALTMYDMLKPIDKGIEIQNIRLISKKGGKGDYNKGQDREIKAGIVVCSDSISKGEKEDKAGAAIQLKLEAKEVNVVELVIIPDEPSEIEQQLKSLKESGVDLAIFTGGTGLSDRDITTDILSPLLDREIPGIAETMRAYGQERMPYAMLSRSLAGVKDSMLVLALPGSTKGAIESLDAIFPAVLHVFKVMEGARHD